MLPPRVLEDLLLVPEPLAEGPGFRGGAEGHLHPPSSSSPRHVPLRRPPARVEGAAGVGQSAGNVAGSVEE